MPNILINLTHSEYNNILFKSNELGLTVLQYAKRRITDDQFCQLYNHLIQQTKKLPLNSTFTVMSMFNNWSTFPSKLKKSLGMNFYHLVKRYGISGVSLSGKNNSKIQVYKIHSKNIRICHTILLYIQAYGATSTRDIISIISKQFDTTRQRISGNIFCMVCKTRCVKLTSNKPNSTIN